jgi:hypothetical protein
MARPPPSGTPLQNARKSLPQDCRKMISSWRMVIGAGEAADPA